MTTDRIPALAAIGVGALFGAALALLALMGGS